MLVFLLVMVVAEALVVRVGFRRRGDLAPRLQLDMQAETTENQPKPGLGMDEAGPKRSWLLLRIEIFSQPLESGTIGKRSQLGVLWSLWLR